MFYLLIYNLLWFALLILSFPYIFYLLVSGKNKIVKDRFGSYEYTEGNHIWIHAASVGEIKIAIELITSVRKKTTQKIILTVVTQTGYETAKKNLPIDTMLCYAPCDFFPVVFKIFKNFSITKLMLIETEIWPSLVTAANFKDVPVCVVNGRISDRAFKRYKYFRLIFKNLFAKLQLVCVQSELDKKRFDFLGAERNIQVLPNLKYDLLPNRENTKAAIKIDMFNNRTMFVAGSIRKGEEKQVINVFRKAKKNFPNLFLVIAPRHFKNIPHIAKLLRKQEINFIKYRELFETTNKEQELEATEKERKTKDVLILDVMGKLMQMYENADVVFVGGSLVDKGGQNILEPMRLGKPVIFGPYMSNFRDIAETAIKARAVIQVSNEDDLAKQLLFLLADNTERNAIAEKAQLVLKENKGGIERTIECLGF